MISGRYTTTLVFLIAQAVILMIPIPATAATQMDLAACISTAVRSNAALRTLGYAKQIKDVQVKTALSNLFPQLSAGINYTNQAGHSYVTDSQTDSSAYDANVKVTQSLFTSGQNTGNLKKARSNYRIAESGYLQEEVSLVASIKKLYYQAVQNTSLISAREAELKRKKNNLAIVQLLYQVGNEKKPNLDQAKYNVKQAEYQLLSAKNSLTTSLQQLKKEMGVDPGADISVVEAYTDDLSLTQEQALARALEERQDLKQKTLSIEINKIERTIAKSDFLPTASISAAYNWAGGSFFPADSDVSTVFSVSLPLSNGFPLYAALKENAITLESLLAEKKSLIDSITIEVNTAYMSVALARDRLSLAADNIAVAQDRATLAGIEYKQGSTSFVEFEQIEDNLSSAEQELVNARYSYESAKAELLSAIGTGTAKENVQ